MMISRLRLENPGAVDISKLVDGGEYWIHQEMSRLFAGEGAEKRSFVYRRDDRNGRPECMVVSAAPPIGAGRVWAVEAKPYAPRISTGELYTFSLRVNPVVTRRFGPDKRHARHDVVMDAKRQRKPAGSATVTQAELCQTAGLEWIRRKGQHHGFTVVEDLLRIGGYRQLVIYKRNRQPIRFSTLEFDGALQVTNSDELLSALFAGVGPAKGFGCGLLLVKRI
jgi:CRISPR system Cascade subunit CasE